MVGFAFSCLDLDAETLQTVVARMIGIVHDRTAKVTSQLAAVRVMIGFGTASLLSRQGRTVASPTT